MLQVAFTLFARRCDEIAQLVWTKLIEEERKCARRCDEIAQLVWTELVEEEKKYARWTRFGFVIVRTDLGVRVKKQKELDRTR